MSFHPQMPYGTPAWHKSERKLPDEGPAFEFTAEQKAKFDEIVTRYPADRRRSRGIFWAPTCRHARWWEVTPS